MTAVAFLLTFSPACAPGPSAEPVQVMILVILATDKDAKVSERIKDIAAEAMKKEPRLTGFVHVNTINQSLKMGESARVELVEKAKADVTVNAKTDDEGRITLTIKPPKVEKITYSCTCGKFLPIMTDYYTAENKRLIIAVMAKPCKKGKK